MPNYDNEILKANIEKLRSDNDMKQEDIAAIAGVQQSRISKLLGNDAGARFTIEQICKIASHFNVSIDYLVTGKEPQPISSTKKVCEALVTLFENYSLETYDFDRIEKISYPVTEYENGYHTSEIQTEKRTFKYHSLFFPYCWHFNPDREYTEEQLENLEFDERYCGNELSFNKEINKFLDAFIPVHKLYDAGKMPEDAYKYTVQSLLEGIK